LEGTHNCVSRL